MARLTRPSTGHAGGTSTANAASRMMLTLLVVLAWQTYQNATYLDRLSTQSSEIENIHNTVNHFENSLQEFNQPKKNEQTKEQKAETAEMIEVMEALAGKIDEFEDEFRRIGFVTVQDKFGDGPYRVEVKLDFPKGTPGKGDSFMIETAPLDLMPHSIHTFLEQVSSGHWNGCSFHRNAEHLIQAGPLPYSGSPEGVDLDERFGLHHHVKFQEYSSDFPHTERTIGFAGRPGGPDFYINVQDNTENNGPGGQLDDDSDPCFAKVVAGWHTVERMHAMETKEESGGAFKHSVGIKSMKVVS